MNIRLGIADSNEFYRKGAKLVLDTFSDIEVVFTVSTSLELLECLKKFKLDALLIEMDQHEINTLDILHEIRKTDNKIKLLILANTINPDDFYKLVKAKVDSILLKKTSTAKVHFAITECMVKGKYFDPQINSFIVELLNEGKDVEFNSVKERFTEKELIVMEFMCKEETSKNIAGLMGISKSAVDKLRVRLHKKTNTVNTAGIILFAVTHNLFNIK